jgi:hypothetical protein
LQFHQVAPSPRRAFMMTTKGFMSPFWRLLDRFWSRSSPQDSWNGGTSKSPSNPYYRVRLTFEFIAVSFLIERCLTGRRLQNQPIDFSRKNVRVPWHCWSWGPETPLELIEFNCTQDTSDMAQCFQLHCDNLRYSTVLGLPQKET